ncbi:hypothetical protein PVK06_035767 [Gossypium arboreum]|uniref:Uncharacterized protein n=1 Tax=Gossypium arboreum TaxID=29729 RepID=A0ABR0NHQ5_GOSAR|nr:hypothetical protein PVK06_035767 [Gossypium arboreum]
MTERSINVGIIIFKEIHDCARKKIESAYFPSLITSLYFRAQVKTKANLNGTYVQICVTTHNLERLEENVDELNPTELSEPTEPEIGKSSNKAKTEANLVIEIEEVKLEEEPNNPELIKELEVSKPRKKSNANEPVEPSVDHELNIPMPTSSDTVKKSKLSIMMDMMKFMHNQQQAYWKYVNIKDDFEDENASEDETSKEEDEEDKSNK